MLVGILRINTPDTSTVVPQTVPGIDTVAPINGSSNSSKTFPLMVRLFCVLP